MEMEGEYDEREGLEGSGGGRRRERRIGRKRRRERVEIGKWKLGTLLEFERRVGEKNEDLVREGKVNDRIVGLKGLMKKVIEDMVKEKEVEGKRSRKGLWDEESERSRRQKKDIKKRTEVGYVKRNTIIGTGSMEN